MPRFLALTSLLLGLAACSTQTGPAGVYVIGPAPEASSQRGLYLLRYSVKGFDAHQKGHLEYLQRLAYHAVADRDLSGEYQVVFTDEPSGQFILSLRYGVETDLMGQAKIRSL